MAEDAENTEVFEKLNDYTLSVTNDFGRQKGADPELRRIFNFKARQVTNIYSMWYNAGVTTSMVIQKFSELDSLDEVTAMHKKLCEMQAIRPAFPTSRSPSQNRQNRCRFKAEL